MAAAPIAAMDALLRLLADMSETLYQLYKFHKQLLNKMAFYPTGRFGQRLTSAIWQATDFVTWRTWLALL
jgi:hypothetical protein